MFSTEFRYKLNNLRRILKKATVQLIRILFILASVATIVLMAYEYGYAISEAGKRYVTEGFNIIIRIFFFGSIATIFLDPKEIWQEKGYWIEIIVLALLLFVILTQTPAHFPTDNWLQKTDHILTHILLLFISIIHLSKVVVTGLQRHIRPEMTFVYSFLAIILTGAFLLMLPKAHHGSLSFIDALFTSTSAVCITGLTVVDTATTFTTTG